MRTRSQPLAALVLAVALAPAGEALQQITGQELGTFSHDTLVTPVPRVAPYDHLTDNCVEVVNLLPEPASGIDYDGDGKLWAVNPYLSRVVAYSGVSQTPDIAFDTGLNPVSLAVWEPLVGERRIVVVCRGTHAAFLHDAADGALEAVVHLDSEPGDLVIDPDIDQAFVSCAGSNTVVQVDLAAFAVVARYDVDCGERPGALLLDRGDPGEPADNRVYVAQTVTGNNTIQVGGGPGSSFGAILDLELFACCELPDEDVFRIDPFAGTCEPIVKRAGSTIFDLELNETTGELWILSTDSINGDPDLDTEPEIRGRFAVNQLVLVPGIQAAAVPVTAADGIDLDDHDPGTSGAQYDAALSINQARSCDITSAEAQVPGLALVASPVSDVILALDDSGDRIAEFQLPPGAQCYDVEVYDPDENLFGALCLGTMTVELFTLVPFTGVPFASLPLGHDPTPDQVRRGRDVFLDGRRSADGRFSCASCHEGGRADQLAWPLRNDPVDVKDVMVTQSLLSIADTFPHHWRGERDLEDFLKAWGGLLGAPESEIPTPPEMDDFVAFVQSLQAPANPEEDPRRLIDDLRTFEPAPNGLVGSAVQGQKWFQTVENFNQQTCASCHTAETGGSGNLFAEFGSAAPRAANIEAAHLRQLQHKGTDTLELDFGNGPREVNENGFGILHNGSVPSLFSFIFDTPVFFTLDDSQRTDVFAFVRQFDQGISPAAHWATFFDESDGDRVINEIEEVLLAGAAEGWNDVVAFGRYDRGAGLEPMRWWYDPSAEVFVPEDPSLAPVTWDDLVQATAAGEAEHALVGVPPCNGRRFGIDADNDGVVNGQELLDGTDPFDPDSDLDGDPDGHERANGGTQLLATAQAVDTTPPQLLDLRLDFANARLAKYHLQADEDVVYSVTYGIQGGPQHVFERGYFSRADTFVLTHSEPSTPTFQPIMHDVVVTLTDRAGNSSLFRSNEPFTPAEASLMFPVFGLFSHVAEIGWMQEERDGDTLDAVVHLRVNTNYGAPDFLPAEGQMVFAIVAVEDPLTGDFVQSTDFTTNLETTFELIDADDEVTEYLGHPGPPWIVSEPTNEDGETLMDFVLSDLDPGQTVKLVVMGLGEPQEDPNDPTNTVYRAGSLFQFQPHLLEDAHELSLEF